MINNAQRKNVSLKVLANELGVSISTVSRALNDHWEISDAMKKTVLDHANRRGYRPNIAAKTLCKGSSDAIGVIVPNFTLTCFSMIADAIVDTIEKRGYRALLFTSRDSLAKETQYVNNMSAMRVCGALISLSQQTKTYEHLQVLKDAAIPVCFYGRIPTVQDEINAVVKNDHTAFYKLTKQLIDKGCRKIAFIGGPDHLSTSQSCKRGYIEAITAAGLEVAAHHIVNTDILDPDYNAIERVMKGADGQTGVDAVICMADSALEAAVKVLNGAQGSMKCTIAGVSESKIAGLVSPENLCMLKPNYKELGIAAANKLIDMIESKRTVKEINFIKYVE